MGLEPLYKVEKLVSSLCFQAGSTCGATARPTSSSAARAADTIADLDVKSAAKVKLERAKRHAVVGVVQFESSCDP
jgi:hypothetical protein